MATKPHILPIIILSQFACTSPWFAANAIMGNLTAQAGLQPEQLGNLLSAVQFGFICGTLAFALLTVADRYPPSKVFLYCALLAATANLGYCYRIWPWGNYWDSVSLLAFSWRGFIP